MNIIMKSVTQTLVQLDFIDYRYKILYIVGGKNYGIFRKHVNNRVDSASKIS